MSRLITTQMRYCWIVTADELTDCRCGSSVHFYMGRNNSALAKVFYSETENA